MQYVSFIKACFFYTFVKTVMMLWQYNMKMIICEKKKTSSSTFSQCSDWLFLTESGALLQTAARQMSLSDYKKGMRVSRQLVSSRNHTKETPYRDCVEGLRCLPVKLHTQSNIISTFTEFSRSWGVTTLIWAKSTFYWLNPNPFHTLPKISCLMWPC